MAELPAEGQGLHLDDGDVAPDGEAVVLEQGLAPHLQLVLGDELGVATPDDELLLRLARAS